MKNLIKYSLITFAVIAFASCRKTEFEPVTPGTTTANDGVKSYHDGGDGGDLFTDKDKCKKCHTGGSKIMNIDWNAPYMSDNRYSTIEEVIDNFDFVNNVHMPKSESTKASAQNISPERKQALLDYLNSLKDGQ